MMELDGEPVAAAELATLAVGNHGHFTSMLVLDGRVRGLRLHLDRLARDSQLLFGLAVEEGRILQLLGRIAGRLHRPTMVRVTIFDAEPGPEQASAPRLLVSTRPAPGPGPVTGLRVRTVEYVRDLPAIKHVGIFGASHQRRLARQAGFDDALFVSAAGLLCEGSTWNLLAQIGTELVLPDDDCLPGVTRALLGDVLDRAGIGWSRRSIGRAELGDLRAAYATSAGAGVRPISGIDARELPGDADLLAAVRAGYALLPAEQI